MGGGVWSECGASVPPNAPAGRGRADLDQTAHGTTGSAKWYAKDLGEWMKTVRLQ
jgi:hypothetical protein